MADDSPNIEAAAEALWCAIWEGDGAWDEATDSEKQTARGWAQAAIDALQLTHEWTRTLGDLYPCGHFASRRRAEARNAELDVMYPGEQLDRGVASRLVSPWVRVDGGTA